MKLMKQNDAPAKPSAEESNGIIRPISPPEYDIAMLTGNSEKLFETETEKNVDAEGEKEEK